MMTLLIALHKGFYDSSTLDIEHLGFECFVSAMLWMCKIPGHNYPPLFGFLENL